MMVTPRDWIPPFPPGDERNKQHRADYDYYRFTFPKDHPSLAQKWANEELAKREHSPKNSSEPKP